MKDKVWEYLIALDQEKEKTWDDCVFVFDSEILLNLYRYTAETRSAVFRSMETVRENLWLPYYAAFDFARRRCDVIYETLNKYSTIQKKIDMHLQSFAADLHMSMEDPEITSMKEKAYAWAENLKARNGAVSDIYADPVLDRILDLFSGKVGDAWTEEQLQGMTEEGRKRQENRIPPEYTEKTDPADDSLSQIYGNTVFWRQILTYASREYRNIIYVTQNVSEDWWQVSNGNPIAARAELKREFHQETGQSFHMYTIREFLERSAEKAGFSLPDSVYL